MSHSIESGIEVIPVPRNRRGEVRWSILKSDPELLQKFIESEALSFVTKGNTLSEDNLVKNGYSWLYGGTRYYPDGITGLKDKLGLTQVTKWDAFLNKYDLTDQHLEDVIEQEARRIIESGFNLSDAELRKAGYEWFSRGISQNFPGGLPALKNRLGLNTSKPDRYWGEVHNIETEVAELLSKFGYISSELLRRKGYTSLNSAISSSYPGGWEGIRKFIGIPVKKRATGFWTPERIEAAAQEILNDGLELTYSQLRSKNPALISAIEKHYQGGIRHLRQKLGQESRHKPVGYWTVETIEKEAAAIVKTYGYIDNKLLITIKQSGLQNAISKSYPGGIRALRMKLINDANLYESADEQLRKLLEGGKL